MPDHLPTPTSLPAFTLSVDAWGRLVLSDSEGNTYAGVEPVRAFPLTEPELWIALVDAEGHERALIESLGQLAPELRATISDELSRREFVPIIQQIEKVEGEPPLCAWWVVTDRGPVRFTVEGEDQVRKLSPGRVVIVDQRGQRYVVDDIARLPPASRKLLNMFL